MTNSISARRLPVSSAVDAGVRRRRPSPAQGRHKVLVADQAEDVGALLLVVHQAAFDERLKDNGREIVREMAASPSSFFYYVHAAYRLNGSRSISQV